MVGKMPTNICVNAEIAVGILPTLPYHVAIQIHPLALHYLHKMLSDVKIPYKQIENRLGGVYCLNQDFYD